MHRWLFLVAFVLTVTPLAAQTRPLTLDDIYDPQRRIDFSGVAPSGLSWLSDRNDLYVINLDQQRQEKQLTTDGTDEILNGKRFGIDGWSFGGFMVTYAMTHSTSFAMGIGGGNVTDWRLYDSIYTERFMLMPQNNPGGYAKSSALAAAKDLHVVPLLIHGVMDENVHAQNTLKFTYELQKAGKQFRLMMYEKSRHGVTDPDLVKHLRQMMAGPGFSRGGDHRYASIAAMARPSVKSSARATGRDDPVSATSPASAGSVRSSHSETVATGAPAMAPSATTLNVVRLRRSPARVRRSKPSGDGCGVAMAASQRLY